MRNALATLALAAGLPLHAAPPPESSAVKTMVQVCDKAMAAAEESARRVSDCFAGFSTAKNVPAQLLKDERFADLAERYFAYKSAIAGDPKICDGLQPVDRHLQCRGVYNQLMFVKAAFGTKAQFDQACRAHRWMGRVHNPKKAQGAVKDELLGEWCQLAWDLKDRPEELCRRAVPRILPPHEALGCETTFAALKGSDAGCARITEARDAADCLDAAAYARAAKGGAAACGASLACRSLAGDGARVMREMGASLSGTPAGRWILGLAERQQARDGLAAGGFICVDPLRSETNRKAALAPLDEAHACLLNVEKAQARADVAAAMEVDSREEKLARLRIRIGADLDGPEPGKTPPPR